MRAPPAARSSVAGARMPARPSSRETPSPESSRTESSASSGALIYVGQLVKLRPIVNRPRWAPHPNSAGWQPARRMSSRMSSCPTALGERKKDLLQPSVGEPRLLAQLRKRSLPGHLPLAQQHQPVAHARRIRELMNGEKKRAALRGIRPQQSHHVASLAEIEPVERLIQEQQRMRRQKSKRQKHALKLTFR